MRSKTSSWFECSVSYEKVQEDGTERRITEKYVVEAFSFTEAEKQIIDELKNYVSGELTVKGIVPAQYKEIFFSVSDVRWFKVKGIVPAQYNEIFFSDADSDDYWFKVKVKFITLDERSNKEKCTNAIYLVQGSDISTAKANIEAILSGSMSDFDLCGINETKILDVFTL